VVCVWTPCLSSLFFRSHSEAGTPLQFRSASLGSLLAKTLAAIPTSLSVSFGQNAYAVRTGMWIWEVGELPPTLAPVSTPVLMQKRR